MGQLIFAAPIAGLLAGLLGAGVVILLYMLKLRRRPVPVSSTMLWTQAVKDMEGNIPWQAARPSILMLLHLLVVALLALAIARPSIGGKGSDQRLILLVDTSASMNARLDADGTTRLDRAKAHAGELVRSLSQGAGTPEITLYRVGGEARIVVGPSRDTKRVLRELGAVSPTDEPGDIDSALESLRSVLGAQEPTAGSAPPVGAARIVVLTDAAGAAGVPSVVEGIGVEVVVADEPARANIGMTALSATRDRADPEVCRLFIRVQSTDPTPAGVLVRALDGDTELGRSSLAFDGALPGGVTHATTTLSVRLARSANIEVAIDRDDALAADNRAWVWVPDPSPVRIVVVADGPANPILLDVLGSISGIDPAVIAPGKSIPAWADLVIADGVQLDQSDRPSISFAPAWGERTERGRRIVSWKRTHPVLRDAGLGSVAYFTPSGFRHGEQGTRVLASGADHPVITERASSGTRHLAVAFDLDDSNWSIQVGFTIFLANAVEYLVPGASGVGEVYRTSVTRPMSGITELTVDDTVRTVGVSLLDADESNTGMIVQERNAAASEPGGNGRFDIQRPLWRWFVLAGFAVMVIEWFLHAGRIRV